MSKCKWIKGGSKKYVLTEAYIDSIPFHPPEPVHAHYCTLFTSGNIVIDEEFEWNGASGPTIDTDDTMDGSLVHDVLYQFMREGRLSRKYRNAADICIYKMCRADGMPWWRASYWYLFLRIGGSLSARG